MFGKKKPTQTVTSTNPGFMPLGGWPAGSPEHDNLNSRREQRKEEEAARARAAAKSVSTRVSAGDKPKSAGGILVVGLALGLCLTPNFPPGPRLILEEHVSFLFGVEDCPKGWSGSPADPIRLARAIRTLDPIIEEENNRINAAHAAGKPEPDYDEPEYDHEHAVFYAHNTIGGYSLDEPVEVGCENANGDAILTEDATDALKQLAEAGYIVDPMNGTYHVTS